METEALEEGFRFSAKGRGAAVEIDSAAAGFVAKPAVASSLRA
jgi:hypothetical protein